jgi:multicomponent Na+:H+ antiporter subunit F
MSNFLIGAAGFVLAMAALGLIRILGSESEADRVMAAQLIGTGGIASLLLLAVAAEMPPIADVALMLALLAAFVSMAFVRSASDAQTAARDGTDPA